jgi:hypothetical protein
VFVSSSDSRSAFVVEPLTIVSPSTTTVPVATASRRLFWKWPLKPGNDVVRGPFDLEAMERLFRRGRGDREHDRREHGDDSGRDESRSPRSGEWQTF